MDFKLNLNSDDYKRFHSIVESFVIQEIVKLIEDKDRFQRMLDVSVKKYIDKFTPEKIDERLQNIIWDKVVKHIPSEIMSYGTRPDRIEYKLDGLIKSLIKERLVDKIIYPEIIYPKEDEN